MKVDINQEMESDFDAIFALIKKAFATEAMSDHREQHLVNRLRKSDAYIPELALVAKVNNELVGHILLTKLIIKNKTGQYDSLALAPVSVLPEFQGRGIGGKLIKEAHERAKQLGHKSIVLLGHDKYYPRFGYQQANNFGIELPFDVPKENCMAIELFENGLKDVSGTVVYPKAFFE